MGEGKNKLDILKKRIKNVAIILLIAIIITLVILFFIIPDFFEKALAFAIILGMVLFIPITVILLFSSFDGNYPWDRFF